MNIRTIALWACLLVASSSFAATTHKVQNGDTDQKIARKAGISVEKLHQLNPGISWTRLKIGTAIQTALPKKQAKAKAKPPTAIKIAFKTSKYTVASGDNDWSIARKFGINTTELKRINPKINFAALKVGAVLTVPATSTTNTVKTSTRPVAKAAPVEKASAKPETKVDSTPSIMSPNAKVNRDAVTLRSTGNTSARKVSLLSKNTVAKIIDFKNGWYQLETGSGHKGWVREDMLSETTNSVTIPVVKTINSSTKTVVSGGASGLLKTAYSQLGIPYVYGGTSRSGFDCSGFVGYVFRQHGVNLPRTAAEQARKGTPVSKAGLKAGDLVFFYTRGNGRVSHVGIWIGNNTFIHASSGGGKIRVNNLTGYYAQRYAGARRVSNKFSGPMSADDYTKYTSTVVEEPSFDPEPEPERPRNNNLGTDVVSQ